MATPPDKQGGASDSRIPGVKTVSELRSREAKSGNDNAEKPEGGAQFKNVFSAQEESERTQQEISKEIQQRDEKQAAAQSELESALSDTQQVDETPVKEVKPSPKSQAPKPQKESPPAETSPAKRGSAETHIDQSQEAPKGPAPMPRTDEAPPQEKPAEKAQAQNSSVAGQPNPSEYVPGKISDVYKNKEEGALGSPDRASRTGRQAEEARLPDKQKPKTPTRDPLYAARVLQQEQEAPKKAAEQSASKREEQKAEKPRGSEKGEEAERESIVRTYESDVAEALRKQETSQVQMVLAEEEKKRGAKEKQEEQGKKSIIFISASIILGLLGAGAIGFGVWYYAFNPSGIQPTERLQPQSFIFVETSTSMDITGRSPLGITNQVQTEIETLDIRLDFVEHIYFTEEIVRSTQPTLEEPETIRTLVTTQQFFNALESRMSDGLKRALDDTFMLGVHSFNGNQPFLILKTQFYENTFAGMLAWEQYIAGELLPLFNLPDVEVERGTPFTDVVRKNRDLRVLKDTSGETALLYTFYDRETIIITAAEETLDEVVTRLNRT